MRARLRHDPEPPDGATKEPWRFRSADLDLAAHVNNAVYWAVVEEQLAAGPDPAEPYAAEIEHRGPTAERDAIVRRAGGADVDLRGPRRGRGHRRRRTEPRPPSPHSSLD